MKLFEKSIFSIFKRKKKKPALEETAAALAPDPAPIPAQTDALEVRVEEISQDCLPDEALLCEVKDEGLLKRLCSFVPVAVKAGSAAGKAASAISSSGETLYRVVIPSGAKLARSKEVAGAVRGFYRGTGGVAGHANLIPAGSVQAVTALTGVAVAAMRVASLIVGQYYMDRIHRELGALHTEIADVSDFQDSEFQSRVLSLVVHVEKIADFELEILENDELRHFKLAQLDGLEEECTKLLIQVNLSLCKIARRSGPDYAAYEKTLPKIEILLAEQKRLLCVLDRIAALRYALHFGGVSRAQCEALLTPFKEQAQKTREEIASWHLGTMERLQVDLKAGRRKRRGLDRAIHFLPGLFKDAWNYRAIDEKSARMMAAQAKAEEVAMGEQTDYYADDVELFSVGGKFYYLPHDDATKD